MAEGRYTRQQLDIAITTSLATTPEIPFEDCEYGTIHVVSGSVTTLTFHSAPKKGGTYEAAYDSAATPAAVVLTVAADQAHPIPEALRGAGAIKIVGNAAGVLSLSLKG